MTPDLLFADDRFTVVTGHVVVLHTIPVGVVEDSQTSLPSVGLGSGPAGEGPGVLTLRHRLRRTILPAEGAGVCADLPPGPEVGGPVPPHQAQEVLSLLLGVQGDQLHALRFAVFDSVVPAEVVTAGPPGEQVALSAPLVVTLGLSSGNSQGSSGGNSQRSSSSYGRCSGGNWGSSRGNGGCSGGDRGYSGGDYGRSLLDLHEGGVGPEEGAGDGGEPAIAGEGWGGGTGGEPGSLWGGGTGGLRGEPLGGLGGEPLRRKPLLVPAEEDELRGGEGEEEGEGDQETHGCTQ